MPANMDSAVYIRSVMSGLAVWWGATLADVHGATPGPRVPAEVVEKWNAAGVVGRPQDAEVPSQFSVEHETHRVAYNFQAPGIAVVPLPDGRVRVWLSWYEQNNKPGGSAIGGGSVPHTVYAYCDDPFGAAEPVWTRVVYAEPLVERGGETASDPEVALLPDGRLLCSYITSGPGRDRKRSSYGFLIANPAASEGIFALGRQHWLGYGVLSQPFQHEGHAHAIIDEWSVARRFCRLEFPETPERDAVRAERLSEIPWPGHPALTIFFESSMHPVSGGRYRAYRRTKEGVYTVLSEPGGVAWGTEEKWTDFSSSNSRSAFARSPGSGRILGAVNCPAQGTSDRTNLTLVVSEAEGAPGTFRHGLNIEPDDGTRKVAAQYPRLAFDPAGHVYCVYRWSDNRKDAPYHGAAIVVARVREDLLASGKATLADVEKRVACEVAPGK
jgi:hypothetical protein